MILLGNFSKDDLKKLGDDGRNALIDAVVDDNHDEVERLYRTLHPLTNEEWLRSATFEELAGAIYEWHTKGYARGRLEVDLNPITEVVDWLKQPHTPKE